MCCSVHICVRLCVVVCVSVYYGVCHSPLQHKHLSIVDEEVKRILVKAETWVATRDGPISELPYEVLGSIRSFSVC